MLGLPPLSIGRPRASNIVFSGKGSKGENIEQTLCDVTITEL
jgi:hypothetical protein